MNTRYEQGFGLMCMVCLESMPVPRRGGDLLAIDGKMQAFLQIHEAPEHNVKPPADSAGEE